jgi:hypothetical protein
VKSRRSFFRKLSAIAATVAIAPKIAFGAIETPIAGIEFHNTTVGIYEQLRMIEDAPLPTAPIDLPSLFKQVYAIKRQRERESAA